MKMAAAVMRLGALGTAVPAAGQGGAAGRPGADALHGGGFTDGSSIEAVAYEGENLSRFGDVVVVTLNHRRARSAPSTIG